MNPLDNPIWQSLNTSHASLAESNGRARKFVFEVSPLGGMADESGQSYAALAELLQPDERVGIFVHSLPKHSQQLELILSGDLLQMIYEDNGPIEAPTVPATPLSTSDVPEMMELAQLTKPGPFHLRTIELGDYFGIRRDGVLVAMTGERLRLPGYTEVSAVCTHPDHLGQGYAAGLVRLVVDRIRARGEKPILHVRGDNSRAVALYQRLGFKKRLEYFYAVLNRR
jgi:ribosomal protein S18 acetylase RimI-like enzyme